GPTVPAADVAEALVSASATAARTTSPPQAMLPNGLLPHATYFAASFSSASALICSFSNSMRPAILPSSKLACCWSWICFCSSAVISSCLVMDSSRLDNDVDEILARDRYLEERAGRKTAGRGRGVRGIRRKGHDL